MLSAPEFARVNRVPVQGLAATALAGGQATIACNCCPNGGRQGGFAGRTGADTYGAGVDFSAGIAMVSADSVKAQAFLSFLTDPKAAAVWKANGVEFIGIP